MKIINELKKTLTNKIYLIQHSGYYCTNLILIKDLHFNLKDLYSYCNIDTNQSMLTYKKQTVGIINKFKGSDGSEYVSFKIFQNSKLDFIRLIKQVSTYIDSVTNLWKCAYYMDKNSKNYLISQDIICRDISDICDILTTNTSNYFLQNKSKSITLLETIIQKSEAPIYIKKLASEILLELGL